MQSLKQLYVDMIVKRILKENALNKKLAIKIAEENWKDIEPIFREWLLQYKEPLHKNKFDRLKTIMNNYIDYLLRRLK